MKIEVQQLKVYYKGKLLTLNKDFTLEHQEIKFKKKIK